MISQASAAQPPSAPWRRRLRRLACGVLLLLAGATLTELWLRSTGWRPPRTFFVVDGEIGRRLVAGIDTTAWGARVVVDERGLRVAPEPTGPTGPARAEPGSQPAAVAAGQPAAERFLFLGGSCTFGYGLEWPATYPAILSELLAGRGREVEVLNGGVPLGDTSNRRALLELHGQELAPTTVVFSEAVNDLAALTAPAHQCYQDGRVMLHVLHPSEEVWPIPSTEPEPVELPRLRLSAWARTVGRHFGWKVFANWIPTTRSFAQSHPPFAWLYRRDPVRWQARLRLDSSRTPHGFALYRDNLQGMVQWCRDRNVNIVFMVQPRRGHQDLYSLLPAPVRAVVAEAIDAFVAGRPEDAVALLEPLVEANPNYLVPRYDLTVALLAAGRPEDATAHAEHLRSLQTFAHNLLMNEVAYAMQVPIANAEIAFQPHRDEDLFLGDGMHPSAAGNRRIAAEVARALAGVAAPGPEPVR